jgi:hypothetical protein
MNVAALQKATKETFAIFIEKSTRLVSSRFVKHMLEGGGNLNVSMKSGENLKIIWDEPDQEAVDAFILTFRFFIQDNERTSLRSLQRLLDDAEVSPHWKAEYNRVRSELNESLDSTPEPIHIVWGGREYTRREVMYIFVFGGLAHANRQKRQIFEDWKTDPNFYSMYGYTFTNTLMEVLRSYLKIQSR